MPLHVPFIQFKLKLNKAPFARSKRREQNTGTYFNRASTGLTSYGKVLVDFFFTPAVATSSILAGDFFLMMANVLLALGYLSQFVKRSFYKEVFLFEGVVTVLGLIFSIGLALYVIPPTSLFLGISVVSAAINYVFLVKNLIIPPLKHMVEKCFLYFGVDIRADYYYEPPLHPIEDEFTIRALLGNQPLDEHNQDKLVAYNKTLRKLCWYHDKYNEALFGSLLRKDDIELVKVDIYKVARDGSARFPLVFFERKISYKCTKLSKLNAVLHELTDAAQLKNVAAYNRLGLQYFAHYVPVDETSLDDSFKQTSKLLRDEVKRQDEKRQELESCVPRPSA